MDQSVDWVSASAMRNYVLRDPLLDWLDLHGEASGFERDPLDPRTDFDSFVARKGREFEGAVIQHLGGLGVGEVYQVADDEGVARDRCSDVAVEATLAAMRRRAPLVARGALQDVESRTFGFPDLLVRSDVLVRLFPGAATYCLATAPAPGLGLKECHYVVVDIKFLTLDLSASGGLTNSGSNPAYKVQLFVYNRALGALQGHLPQYAFLLGRGWKQTKRRETQRVGNCMDQLAPIGHDESTPRGMLREQADSAAAWVRRVRGDGHCWSVLPDPSVPELRPNATGDHGPWKSAVGLIVDESKDLTRLWYVSAPNRDKANARGLLRWTDPEVTPAAVGVTGSKRQPLLQALLDVNRGDGLSVQPARVGTLRTEWHQRADAEFYVDFETVTDLDDDFSAIPERGGLPLIFMIGCGHLEDEQWRFSCFTADDLTEESEEAVIEAWIDHMGDVTRRLGANGAPRMFHWSAHEVTSLESAFNAAAARHPAKAEQWSSLEWFDFLKLVVKAEPVVVRGAHAFGLKAMANALAALGHIDISWDTGPTDGLGAMVGAWWCQDQVSAGQAQRLADVGLMREIEKYNEIDCKAMMAIISYLRNHH